MSDFFDENFIQEIIDWNSVVMTSGSKQSPDQAKKLIEEEWKEFNEADQAGDDVETLDACVDLIWVIVGYAINRGWDILGAMDNVSQSNFSKFIIDDEEQAEMEVARLLSEGVEGAHYIKVYDNIFILKDANNKVRKPSTYIPADVKLFAGADTE